jgi:hypothetical protein
MNLLTLKLLPSLMVYSVNLMNNTKLVSVSIIDTCSDYQEESNYNMLEKTGKVLLVFPKTVITVPLKLLVIEN